MTAALQTQMDAGLVHVVLRTPDMTLSQIQQKSLEDERLTEFMQEAEFRLFMPEGLGLPANFFDVPASEQWRYRMFALITDALNSVALEIRRNDLNSIDTLIRIVAAQA